MRSGCDHCVFYNGCILLVVYANDIVFIGSNVSWTGGLNSFFGLNLDKSFGYFEVFFGNISSSVQEGNLSFSDKVCLQFTHNSGMLGAKLCDTPMDSNLKLTLEFGNIIAACSKYRRFVGKLNYLIVTQPDISFLVDVVSQFMSSLTTVHWEALVWILRYSKGAPRRGIWYKDHGCTRIEGFSDADWDGSPFDEKSTTSY